MTYNLLPCPFCGGYATLEENDCLKTIEIVCNLCNAIGPRISSSGYGLQELVELWNTRESMGVYTVTSTNPIVLTRSKEPINENDN